MIFSSEDVLIETFIDQAKNLQTLIDSDDEQSKRLMARLGIRTIFKMIIFDNFIHADCHAGNLLV